MGWHDFETPGISVSIGEAESRRFGFQVLNIRVGIGTGNSQKVLSALVNEPYDLAVVRYPSTDTKMGAGFSHLGHISVLAEPTIYWRSNPALTAKSAYKPGDLERVDATSLNILNDVIASSFDGYVSHWHHNPMTASINMVHAYTEWTNAVIRDESHSAFLLRSSISREPMGMALTEEKHGVLEVLLAGIVPKYQGQGHYSTILRELEAFARVSGCSRVVISTQASNFQVQKAWARHGWSPYLVLQCVHFRGNHVK
jgi:ribosomal protein S18 acetylase RimI-like enzyme